MNTTKETLQTCWSHAWRHKRYLIPLLVSIPISVTLLRLVPPILIAEILNRLSTGNYIAGDAWGSFGKDILLYAALALSGGVIAWRITIYLIWKLESYVQRDIYRRMFAKFMELGADFHSDNFGGSLVSQTNKFVGAYIRLQDTFAFQVYTFITSFIFMAFVLYPKAPAFVWALGVFAVVFIVFAVALSKRVRKLAAIEADSQNKITGQLADAITNVMAVKSFSARQKEEKRFAEATEYSRLRTIDVMWATTWRDVASSTITACLGIAALVAAIIAVVNYGANIGTVFLVLAYSADLSERLWELSSTALRTYNRAMGDAHDAIITLATKPTVLDPEKPKKLSVATGTIEFKDVDFAHGGEDDALFKNFNLHIEPGSHVGLVGRSGSGKTTLTRLLLRYMDIDKGAITIDGQKITETSQDDLRKYISYVPQEPMLFHRSLTENIGYGKPDYSHEQILRVSKSANAHEFIKNLPKGYETLVGERGVKLSGGQRQRIAIARAMIKDSPILVLDEATSALDSESEKLIQEALWKLMEGKTAVVIAHRLSTIQKMDKILVLENGEIIEQGSHKELLKNDGIYAELWKHQSGGFIEE